MKGTNIFNRIVETIKQLLALFKDFFRSFGIKDELTVQIRVAAFNVGRKDMTIDEAIAMYGSFK